MLAGAQDDGLDVHRCTARVDQDLHLAHSFSAKGKKLGGADALHLAAAIRLGSEYLMAQDCGFPLGQTVEGVRVMLPEQVWQPTLLDDA